MNTQSAKVQAQFSELGGLFLLNSVQFTQASSQLVSLLPHFTDYRLQPVPEQPGGAAEAAAQVRHTRHRLLHRVQHTQVLRGADCGTYVVRVVLIIIQSAPLGQSQGFVKCILGSSTGWWADTIATLLPGQIARGINTEPRGLT